METQGTGYFVSDLHLFTSRSLADAHLETIEDAVSNTNFFVLGGDIFDFRWSTHQSIDRSIHIARNWLEKLILLNRDCKLHFVLGNHDYNRLFMQQLRALANEHDQFDWHRWFYRHENKIFMHGDASDGAKSNQDLKRTRAKHLKHKKKHKASHLAYDVAVSAKLHKIVPMIARPKKLVAKRIEKYLANEGQTRENGVTDIYFGHTHLEMDQYQYNGYTFHNGGAPLKGMKFRMVPVN